MIINPMTVVYYKKKKDLKEVYKFLRTRPEYTDNYSEGMETSDFGELDAIQFQFAKRIVVPSTIRFIDILNLSESHYEEVLVVGGKLINKRQLRNIREFGDTGANVFSVPHVVSSSSHSCHSQKSNLTHMTVENKSSSSSKVNKAQITAQRKAFLWRQEIIKFIHQSHLSLSDGSIAEITKYLNDNSKKSSRGGKFHRNTVARLRDWDRQKSIKSFINFIKVENKTDDPKVICDVLDEWGIENESGKPIKVDEVKSLM